MVLQLCNIDKQNCHGSKNMNYQINEHSWMSFRAVAPVAPDHPLLALYRGHFCNELDGPLGVHLLSGPIKPHHPVVIRIPFLKVILHFLNSKLNLSIIISVRTAQFLTGQVKLFSIFGQVLCKSNCQYYG